MTKNGLLTTTEKSSLESLLRDPYFKGKEILNHLIWLNTTKPKYVKGECFKVTDRGMRFFGVPAVNINASVESVSAFRNSYQYRYTLIARVVNSDGRELTTKMFADEKDLTERATSNDNYINGSGEYAESIEV